MNCAFRAASNSARGTIFHNESHSAGIALALIVNPPRQPQPLPFQIELKGNQRISRPTPLSSSSSSAPTIISYWLVDATYGTEELTISFLWPFRAPPSAALPQFSPPSFARHQIPPITRPNCAYRWINIGLSTLSLKGGCCR